MAEDSLADQIDTGRPSVARMYDYYLGGKDNYTVDRSAADQMLSAVPESREMVRANRAFLVRAVHYMAAELGIRQFLDIGSGLPTRQNVHAVAQGAAPDSRVVYVDHDPHAVVHGRALLTNDNTVFTQGDLRRPEKILEDPRVRALIDFDEPVAVLIVAILHFVSDEDDPSAIVGRLREAMAPGSHLAVSHVLDDPRPHAIGKILTASGAPQWYPRTYAGVLRFFDGFGLVDPPGLAVLPQWRPPVPAAVPLHRAPGDTGELHWQVAGLARRP